MDLSSSEIAGIEKSLKDVVGGLIKGCETLDMELAFDLFWDSHDFRMIAMDGSMCDYQTYLRNNIEYLETCSSFELTTLQAEITVLASDLAVYSWIYQAKATLNSGEQDVVDKAGASFVFKRLGDTWKAIHYHESTLPPTRVTL